MLFFLVWFGPEVHMAKRQIVNGIRIFSWHSKGCKHEHDSSYLTCRCPKWLQWQENGKQNKRSAGTRSKTGAEDAAKRKAEELDAKNEPADETDDEELHAISATTDAWLQFRESEGLNNTKPKIIVNMLLKWAREKNLTYMEQITKAALIAWRTTWPFRRKDSSSLKVHWSVLSGFFSWCLGADILRASPFPKGPQFRIRFTVPEVQPLSQETYDKIIAAVDKVPNRSWTPLMRHQVRTFIHTMRRSGMALVDTATLPRTKMEGNLIRSNRTKTKERFRVRIPQWLANDLAILPCTDPEYFFWHRGRWSDRRKLNVQVITNYWADELRKVFKAAGVEVHSHQFRHTFISGQLAHGTAVDDVAVMAGVSPAMIRKTYQHWIKEAEDRLDKVQEQTWLQEGLDRNGNKFIVQ
jgi:integrase